MASVIRPIRQSKQIEFSRVKSLSFHPTNGKHLFITSTMCHATKLGSSIRLYDCVENRILQSIQVPQNKNGNVVATHSEYCCLSTTSRGVEYISLYDNKVLRSFLYSNDEKHEVDITSLSISPADDKFMTVDNKSRDVRLWDVTSPSCLAKLDLGATPISTSPMLASFDSTGLVFAISAKMNSGDGNYVHLYDARNYSAGAFAELKLNRSDVSQYLEDKHGLVADEAWDMSGADWGCIQFSSSGKQLLISAKQGLAMTMDGFTGALGHIFIDDIDSESNPSLDNAPSLLDTDEIEQSVAACFTPDEKTILIGSCQNLSDSCGVVMCYDAESGQLLSKLEGHVESVGCIACSPKYAILATSCINTALWSWS